MKKHTGKKPKEFIITASGIGAFVFVVITVMLVLSIADEMINPAYQANPALYGVFSLVAGFFLKDVYENK